MQILNNIQTLLIAVGAIVLTICLMIAGLMIAAKMKRDGDSFREAIDAVSGILIGGLIFGAAPAIIGFIMWAADRL